MNWINSNNIADISVGIATVSICYGTDSLGVSWNFGEILVHEELSFAKRLRNELQRTTWLSCRSALRIILGTSLGIKPAEIVLRKNRFGKLYVPNSNLSFNVSHTDKSFLLGFNYVGRIGVDLEYISGKEDIPLLIEYAFSLQETDYCYHGNLAENFLRIWTLKEAYLKATGVGLVDHLKSVNVHGTTGSEIEARNLSQETITCPNGEMAGIVYRNEKPINYIWLK